VTEWERGFPAQLGHVRRFRGGFHHRLASDAKKIRIGHKPSLHLLEARNVAVGIRDPRMPTIPQTRKRILIVEDDAAIRDALTLLLRDEGYAVVGAPNGLEALRHLKENGPPDLILLDLMMPVMDGWQFSKEQQQDPSLKGVPVVLLSANGNVQQRASMLGAVGFLQKPVEVAELLDAIHRYCGERGLIGNG
jgi:CheY-like chemotaxis protein